MAHVARRDDEDHVLGDVGGVIADPLEVAGDEDQVQRGLDGAGVLEHVGQQFAEDLGLELSSRSSR